MLLCLFHVHQSWKNKLNELLDSKKTSQIICLRKQVKKYIKEILDTLCISLISFITHTAIENTRRDVKNVRCDAENADQI